MILNTEILNNLAAQFGLPLHVYFPEKIGVAASEFKAVANRLYPKTEVKFAVKSNPCSGAIRAAASFDLGVDVVSEFELQAALNAGINGNRIVCNGNAKTDRFLKLAIQYQTTIAVDSFEELSLVASTAQDSGVIADVMIRLSGMELDGLTAPDQSTAAHWTKFGIPVKEWRNFFEIATKSEFVNPIGISAHIGTQICDETGYERLISVFLGVIEEAYHSGWHMKMVDIGGGYPLNFIDERDWNTFRERIALQRNGAPIEKWVTWGEFNMGGGSDKWRGKAYWSRYPGARMLEHLLRYKPDGQNSVADRLRAVGEPILLVEPGRALIGDSGITLAEVMGVKQVERNSLVILNLGVVNHGTVLVTPDIYPMTVLPERPDDQSVEVFVAGRLCFTGDMISKVKIPLNRLPKRGEVVAIGMTGAYCADHFASNSCGFPRPAKVAVMEDGSFELWRNPETFKDVFA